MFLSVEKSSNKADDQRDYNVVIGVEESEEKQTKGEDEDDEAKSVESAFYFLQFLKDNHEALPYDNKLNITRIWLVIIHLFMLYLLS